MIATARVMALCALSLGWGCYVAPARTAPTSGFSPGHQRAGPPGSLSPAPPSAPLPSRARSSEVEVSVTENQYDIRGVYAWQLRDEMNRRGPLDRDGVRHDAYTGWYITWTYPYATSARGCSTGPVRVTVYITYTLPRWIPPSGVNTDLRWRWQRYTQNLRVHEDVHRDFGVHAGEAIKRHMQALAAHPTCGGLELSADALGRQLLDKYQLMERTYDQNTRHGATQGASFP